MANRPVSYTLQISDLNGIIRFNTPVDVTLTLPQQSTLALQAGSTFQVVNTGAGKVTLMKEGIDILYGNTVIDTQGHTTVTLIAAGSPNSWYVTGATSVNLDNRQLYIDSVPAQKTNIYPLMIYTSGFGTIINFYATCGMGSCDLTLQIDGVNTVTCTAYSGITLVPMMTNNFFRPGSRIIVIATTTISSSDLVFGVEYLYRGVL